MCCWKNLKACLTHVCLRSQCVQQVTIAVAQACLLLAYEEFGTDHDSGLWMYLGTAIRMAQDLGIQKLEGLQIEGRIGPTPKTAKNGELGKSEELKVRSKKNLWRCLFLYKPAKRILIHNTTVHTIAARHMLGDWLEHLRGITRSQACRR